MALLMISGSAISIQKRGSSLGTRLQSTNFRDVSQGTWAEIRNKDSSYSTRTLFTALDWLLPQ